MVANGNSSSLAPMPIYKQSSMSGIYKIINQFSVPVTVGTWLTASIQSNITMYYTVKQQQQ